MKTLRIFHRLLAFLLLGSSLAVAQSGLTRLGEFKVNTTIEGASPAVSTDAHGNFVVVWGADGIFFQRYNSAGSPIGGQEQAVSSPTGAEGEQAVAVAPTGEFVIVWTYDNGTGRAVFARRFNADGTSFGGAEFRVDVSASRPGPQDAPVVVMRSDGSWIVAWRTKAAANNQSVRFQRYNRFTNRGALGDGLATGPVESVDANAFDLGRVSISAAENRDFVLV